MNEFYGTIIKMKQKAIYIFLWVVLLLPVFQAAKAQKITFSDPSRSEGRATNFDIVGQYNNHFLIYKNYRNTNYITRYSQDMKLVENISMPYMPDRLLETNFIPFSESSYFFYQFLNRGVVYINMVQIGPDGRNLTEPVTLDTTHVGYSGTTKVYQVLVSEDKNAIALLKVNSRNERNYVLGTKLYNHELTLQHSSTLNLPMPQRNDVLSDFQLDNAGNLVFGRGVRQGASENISQLFMIVKPARLDSFIITELPLEKKTLDEVKVKIDNVNKRYLFTAFYYGGRRTAIEGIANAIYDQQQNQWAVQNFIPFSEQLREDARGKNNAKSAFNDFYIQDVTIRSDGAFLINSESQYQSTRGNFNPYNRWNNSPWNNPFMYSSGYYGWGAGGWGNPLNSWYSPFFNPNNNITRFSADDIMILAFDKTGKLILSNFVHKTQMADYTDNAISYKLINTGNGLHYLYNDFEKRDILLSYQTLTPDGKVIRNPAFKNMRNEFSLLNKFARQVDLHTVIIPCIYKNYLSFAKLDLP